LFIWLKIGVIIFKKIFPVLAITRNCVVHVDHRSFQRLAMTPWCDIPNKTGHNNISEELCVVRRPFRNIKKTVDYINWPKDRNRALFCVNFLFDSMRKVITRRGPERVTAIIHEEPWLITSDNPFKVGQFMLRQCR
jgi:hypothetical protein